MAQKNYEAVPEYLLKEHVRVQNELYKIIVTMYSVILTIKWEPGR